MTNLNYLIYTKNYSMQQYLSIMVCLTLLSYLRYLDQNHIHDVNSSYGAQSQVLVTRYMVNIDVDGVRQNHGRSWLLTEIMGENLAQRESLNAHTGRF